MKLKEFKYIIAADNRAIICDVDTDKTLEYGCYMWYAFREYGDYKVYNIASYYDPAYYTHYLIINIGRR